MSSEWWWWSSSEWFYSSSTSSFPISVGYICSLSASASRCSNLVCRCFTSFYMWSLFSIRSLYSSLVFARFLCSKLGKNRWFKGINLVDFFGYFELKKLLGNFECNFEPQNIRGNLPFICNPIIFINFWQKLGDLKTNKEFMMHLIARKIIIIFFIFW